ncbi:XRE family transcriptional regulator [Saccharopolyspora aridisoli]|uniref:XRE family transcriptional regulator n=1 Tax=Saccharopolyspora aridisoli TaxID=2530385 RepID=A0A4R4UYT2_9PSEU|nr:helix-turn-helix transcriptional regulator [Saccharopolyspora aridisoli]TDC94023.1 XRE family transcriptional regulator [Saccharopolyspora aridisoli]
MGKDWDAVATAINTRLAELDLTQRELAERSGVSTATLRQLQNNYEPRRRSPRLLAAISEALRWPSDHLAQVLEGESPEEEADLRAEVARLRKDVAELRERLGVLEEKQA